MKFAWGNFQPWYFRTAMRMWAVLTAIVQVSAAAFDEFMVGGRLQLRQLADERNDIPDIFITHALAPRRHPRHLDAVFDYPERFARIGPANLAPRWWFWVKANAQFRFLYPGGKVARSTHGVVVSGTQSDARVVIQVGGAHCRGARLDRAIAHDTENLARHRPVGLICGNVEQTRMNKYHNAD